VHHIDLKHEGLRKFRRLSGADKYVLEQRARLQTEKWDEQWRRRVLLDRHTDELLRQLPDFEAQKAHAAKLTAETQRGAASLSSILAEGLEATPFKMEMLYDFRIFPEPRPVAPVDRLPPPAPNRRDPLFETAEIDWKDLWTLLLLHGRPRQQKAAQLRKKAAQSKYDLAYRNWLAAREDIARQNARAKALFEADLDAWWERAQAYQKRQQEENAKIDKFRLNYAQGRSDAVIEFLDAALSHSEYPDMFPMRWEMSFETETGSLVIDYELPSPEIFPTLKAVKFDVLRDTFVQNCWSETEVAELYESAIYQTCLRTLHDALAADEAEVVCSVTFNGWVNFTDKIRDTPARTCIMSVQATRSAISQANLLAADPKTTFKKLKGVAGARLADLAAVVPIMWLKRTDDRFVAESDAIEKDSRTQAQSPSSPSSTAHDPAPPPSVRH
jgi:restriction system protein